MYYDKRQRAGFTLIELLVVISIIALLLSIMLPSLMRVKEAARQVACLSNLKQMGIAVHLYANDYNNYLPQVYGQRGWTDCLPNYLGSFQGDWDYFYETMNCPSKKFDVLNPWAYGASSGKNISTKVAFVFSPAAIHTTWPDVHRKLGNIKPNSLLFSDSWRIDLANPSGGGSLVFTRDLSDDGVNDSSAWAFLGDVVLRHGNRSSEVFPSKGQAGAVFASGDARAVDYEELTENSGDNSLWRNMK